MTVLFADLVGFTTLAEDHDPEDTRELLTRYFELTRTIVERYGGTIEKFIGDAVMAVWGAPTAHEDDAERAVRAALDIVSGVPSLGDKLDGPGSRRRLLTGEAAVTIGATGQGMVAGDLVNTASRLQSVAPPGTVLVGEATYRAAAGAIAFEEAGEQLLKGKAAPVPAWRATAVVAIAWRGRPLRRSEPPFTGRDEELRLLKELFHATEREGKARLVAVVGQGGIGKSRLAWEFEKYIDGVVDTVWWHYGRSPAYGEGISYWALAEMVRGRAGIAETDEPGRRPRIDCAKRLTSGSRTSRNVAGSSRAWPACSALEPMPPGSRDELFAAWRTFFERVAERGPTVLVFEDLQWADDGMLDFIDRAARPIAQPADLRDRAGSPGAERASPGVEHQPAQPHPDEPRAARARADGGAGSRNGAWHLRCRRLERSSTARRASRCTRSRRFACSSIAATSWQRATAATSCGRSSSRLAVPETLHALIAARLDALGEQDREVDPDRRGRRPELHRDALAAVARRTRSNNVRDRLAAMVVAPARHASMSTHARQSAASTSSCRPWSRKSPRARCREPIAARCTSRPRAIYESLGDDELAGVLASHYVSSAYRASSPGPEADALAAQARVSLRGAAERAVEPCIHTSRRSRTSSRRSR